MLTRQHQAPQLVTMNSSTISPALLAVLYDQILKELAKLEQERQKQLELIEQYVAKHIWDILSANSDFDKFVTRIQTLSKKVKKSPSDFINTLLAAFTDLNGPNPNKSNLQFLSVKKEADNISTMCNVEYAEIFKGVECKIKLAEFNAGSNTNSDTRGKQFETQCFTHCVELWTQKYGDVTVFNPSKPVFNTEPVHIALAGASVTAQNMTREIDALLIRGNVTKGSTGKPEITGILCEVAEFKCTTSFPNLVKIGSQLESLQSLVNTPCFGPKKAFSVCVTDVQMDKHMILTQRQQLDKLYGNNIPVAMLELPIESTILSVNISSIVSQLARTGKFDGDATDDNTEIMAKQMMRVSDLIQTICARSVCHYI